MALRNANSRLSAIGKSGSSLRMNLVMLEEEYAAVEKERDLLYSTFEDSVQRVRQQSDFQNQALEQKLVAAESNVQKAALQVEEIIRAANMDSTEVARMMTSLNQMLAAKEEVLSDVKFNVTMLQKSFNDTLEIYSAKMKELGIPEEEISNMGFSLEPLPKGCTSAPFVGILTQMK